MTPTLYLNFFTGLLVSFLGTLPLGILNLTAMDVSVKKGIKSALSFAIACSLVEFVYSYISVQLTRCIVNFPALKPITEVLATLTLLAMGIYYIRKQNNLTKTQQKTTSSFYMGMLLSILNMVAFPFWILYTTVLQSKGLVGLSNQGLIVIYVLGIAFGTVAGLLPFIYAGRFLTNLLTVNQYRMNRLLGSLFLFLSACQFISLWL